MVWVSDGVRRREEEEGGKGERKCLI